MMAGVAQNGRAAFSARPQRSRSCAISPLAFQSGTRLSKQYLKHGSRCRTSRVKASSSVTEIGQLWQQDGAVELKGVGIKEVQGTACLYATQDIKANTTVVSVKDDAWISPQTAQQPEIASVMSSISEPWLQIALYLVALDGTAQQQSARWLQHLRGMRQPPLLWSDDVIDELAGSQLAASLQGYRTFFASKYEELRGIVGSAMRDDVLTFERFVWACAMVRCAVLPPLEGQSIAIVPVASLVGHSRAPNVRLNVQSGGVFSRRSTCALTSQRDIAAGETLTIDFAPSRLEHEIVLDYGCYDASSPQKGYKLTLELPETDAFFDDKIDILELNGLQRVQTFTLRADSPPQPELLAFLRLLYLSGADAFLLESIFRNEVWGHMMNAVSEDNERRVCEAMMHGCTAALREYASPSIADDAAAVTAERARDVASNHRLIALQVRLDEKRALDVTARAFEDRLQKLSTLEYYQERRLKRLGLLDEEGNSTFDDFFKGGIA